MIWHKCLANPKNVHARTDRPMYGYLRVYYRWFSQKEYYISLEFSKHLMQQGLFIHNEIDAVNA